MVKKAEMSLHFGFFLFIPRQRKNHPLPLRIIQIFYVSLQKI